jgi:biotin carboxyl carrier protein
MFSSTEERPSYSTQERNNCFLLKTNTQCFSEASKTRVATLSEPGDTGSHARACDKGEVEKGTNVEGGAGLVVLEAMKMENEIHVPMKGTVREIYASEGATVERGETLLSLIT